MPALSQKSTAEVVREMNEFYQPDNEACGRATPQQMALLLDRLSDYTKLVKQAADQDGLLNQWTDPWTGEQRSAASEYNPQFAVDMASWEKRLAHYKQAVYAVPEDKFTTAEGCELIYPTVTAPLLDGIWYEVLDGVNLNSDEKQRINSGEGHPQTDVATTVGGNDHPPGHSNAKPPDVIAPFTLGNQALVFHEHQEERFKKFWADLKKSASDLVTDLVKGASDIANKIDWSFLVPVGIALLGVAGVGFLLYYLVERTRLRSEELKEERY